MSRQDIQDLSKQRRVAFDDRERVSFQLAAKGTARDVCDVAESRDDRITLPVAEAILDDGTMPGRDESSRRSVATQVQS